MPAPEWDKDIWWRRDRLDYNERDLTFAGRRVADLAARHGTPLYLYDAARIKHNLQRLHAALDRACVRHRVFYAMKSNRFSPILTYLKTLGLCGIDACSPGELRLASECGFREEEVSYTGTSLSNSDYAALLKHADVRWNIDSLTAIRRIGEAGAARRIGLRINPGLGVGYESNDQLVYSGDRTTKFGIYLDRFQEALDLAERSGLSVVGLHLHTGCGYLTGQLDIWQQILTESLQFIDLVPDIEYVNIGGGLGIPLVENDRPLDIDRWAGVLSTVFGGRSFEVWVEPGDYIVKDSGLLVLQVNSVEKKRDTVFVGVDGGFNIHIEPVVYRLPLEPVPCRRGDGSCVVTIAGNINEAMDVLADGVALPYLAEGEYLAFLNAGGYGSAMSSNHCMRGSFTEMLLF